MRLVAVTLGLALIAAGASAAPRHRTPSHHGQSDARVTTATYRVSARHPGVRPRHAVLGTRHRAVAPHRRALLAGS